MARADRVDQARRAARVLPWWQPWAAVAGFAALVHFAWEMLQVPYFRDMPTAPHWQAVRTCAVATVGDVVLTLVAYGAVAAVAGSRVWLGRPGAVRMAGYLLVGIVVTASAEYLSVHVLGRWAYRPGAPTVLGLGLTPLLQWILLPPLTLWLARGHLGWTPYHPDTPLTPELEISR